MTTVHNNSREVKPDWSSVIVEEEQMPWSPKWCQDHLRKV